MKRVSFLHMDNPCRCQKVLLSSCGEPFQIPGEEFPFFSSGQPWQIREKGFISFLINPCKFVEKGFLFPCAWRFLHSGLLFPSGQPLLWIPSEWYPFSFWSTLLVDSWRLVSFFLLVIPCRFMDQDFLFPSGQPLQILQNGSPYHSGQHFQNLEQGFVSSVGQPLQIPRQSFFFVSFGQLWVITEIGFLLSAEQSPVTNFFFFYRVDLIGFWIRVSLLVLVYLSAKF